MLRCQQLCDSLHVVYSNTRQRKHQSWQFNSVSLHTMA